MARYGSLELKLDTLPSQIYPDLSCVIQRLSAIENDCPLGGYDSHKEVEPKAAEAITHWKSAQEAES